jgi:hypothetical protein
MAAMIRRPLSKSPPSAQISETPALEGEDVGGGGHPGLRSPGEGLEHLIVCSHHHLEVREPTVDQMIAVDVAGGLLDGADIGASFHARQERLAHHHAGAAGIVVEHDRQGRRAIDGQNVLGQLRLVGKRIGRGGDQQGVHSGIARRHRYGQAFAGAHVVDPGHQKRPAGNAVARKGDLLEALVFRQGVDLAGRAADDDARHPGLDLELDDFGVGVPVDGEVRMERGDDRRVDSLEAHGAHLPHLCRQLMKVVVEDWP